MDHFASGIHYLYDYSRNSFIPFDEAVLATGSPINHQATSEPGEQDECPSSEPHSASSTTSGPYRATNADTGTPDALRTEGSSPSRARGPSELIDNSISAAHIPRPRNAFMIFRAEFSSDKINRSVEHDNRHISRIIGYCWNKLSEEEKLIWRRKAEMEKLAHMKKHPNYRFTPTIRARKPRKRMVNRNGQEEIHRCQQVADLLLSGKEGEDLADAVKQLDSKELDSVEGHWERPAILQGPCMPLSRYSVGSEPYPPPFCYPLLPPSEVSARHSTSHPSARSALTCMPNLPRQLYVPPTIITSPGSPESEVPYFLPSTEKADQSASIASPSCPQSPIYLHSPYAPNFAQRVAHVQAPSYPDVQSGPQLNMCPI